MTSGESEWAGQFDEELLKQPTRKQTQERAAVQPPAELYDRSDGDNVCYLCEKPRYERVCRSEHFGFPLEFQRCACGLIKQVPMPNIAFFEWFFNSDQFFSARRTHGNEIWGYYDFFADEACRLATSRRRYAKLRSYFERGSALRILKIGPSTGTFLHVAQERGHQALGCDVSARFVDYARRNYGVEIHHGRFEKLSYERQSFDIVLLFNVIENVPNQAEFLSRVHDVLKNDGLFILNFVNMHRNVIAKLQQSRYFIFRPPVCYAYERAAMERVLEKFGFHTQRMYRDVRYLTVEKMATLLGLNWPLAVARRLKAEKLALPIYAYPSRICVARRI